MTSKLLSLLILAVLSIYIERLLQALIGLVVVRQNILQFFLLHLLLMVLDWLQHSNSLILGSSQIHEHRGVRLVIVAHGVGSCLRLKPAARLRRLASRHWTLLGSTNRCWDYKVKTQLTWLDVLIGIVARYAAR